MSAGHDSYRPGPAEERLVLDPVEQAVADIAAGQPSSWWTTRTARTRATSSSPPRRPPPRSSPS
ncbi:hypothetical protein ACFQVA_04425 [Actinomadura keratinilytica]